jgi:hypothetical protein
MTRKDPADRIVEIALGMVPCSHLAIWTAARKEFDDLDPSSVWRALILDGRFLRETSTGHFRRTDG